MTGTPRDIELDAVVDQDELIERADRWTVLAAHLAQIHDSLRPGVSDAEETWIGAAAEAFFAALRPLLGEISLLAEQLTLVKNVLLSVQEEATPVRQALYRDVIGWQRDLAGIAQDERQDPLHADRYETQRAAATDRWTSRAQADAGPLVDVLAAGAATLATIDPKVPRFDTDPG